MTGPRVAVCIPVRDDTAGLRRSLESIRSASTDKSLEVVVALDGVDDELRRIAETYGARVVVLDEPRGSYSARNAAIDAVSASVEIIIFTDAGCTVRPGWATAHQEALECADLSGGAVAVTLSARPTAAEVVDSRTYLQQERYVTEFGFSATCNLAIRRTVLDVMRFDGARRSGGDVEFCHRATDAGFRLTYAPLAVVEHPARPTSRELLRKAARVGAGLATLPPRSRPPMPAVPRANRGLARSARIAGTRRGFLLEARVVWLDLRRRQVQRRAFLRGTPRRER